MMDSSLGLTDSEVDTLHQRNVMDSHQEVQPQNESGPTREENKCKKTIGRTPDGVGGFMKSF